VTTVLAAAMIQTVTALTTMVTDPVTLAMTMTITTA
jgi:hypothetical protein